MRTRTIQALILGIAAAVAITLSARANPDLYNVAANSTSCYENGGTIPLQIFSKNISPGSLPGYVVNVCASVPVFGISPGSANQPPAGTSAPATCSLGHADRLSVTGNWPVNFTNSWFVGSLAPTAGQTATFQVSVSDGTHTPVTTGLSIPACVVCNPPLTLDPPGGSLQPVTSTENSYQRLATVHGATPPFGVVQTSGGPPGLDLGNQPDVVSTPIVASIRAGAPPGTYTFQVTVKDARGCTATGTYSITVVGPGAGCVIQLNANPLEQVRVGSSVPVTFTAKNIGDASCTGPFTVNVGPGLPSLSSTPGSAFSMTGTSGSTGQQFSGSGTIPPGKFVGVNSVYPTAVAGTRQVVVTLNFGTGSQSVTLNTTLDFDVLPSRGDIQRQILHPVRTGVRRP